MQSEKIDDIVKKELDLQQEIETKSADARRALEDLYDSVKDLYILRKGTKVFLVDVDEFVKRAEQQITKTNIPALAHKKQEILEALQAISWYISSATNLINQFETESKKYNE